MNKFSRLILVLLLLLAGTIQSTAFLVPPRTNPASCKLTPYDPSWPSAAEWIILNKTIGGVLIQSRPSASSCYPGNPFNSTENCNLLSSEWATSALHERLPESVSFPIFANNSCLPPGAPGYPSVGGCTYGGYPRYVVNATSAEQIATAVKWAAERNIRVIVKGTGHDLCGRSSGAFSLSIWTHNFKEIQFTDSFIPVGASSNASSEDAVELGSGWLWGQVYAAADEVGKVVVGGGEPSVGVGGHIQGGGHGPLTSTYGMAADNVLQATVVTTEGNVLVVNAYQNIDLYWAIRGGGPGVYGIVTSFVLKTYPSPTVTLSNLIVQSSSNTSAGISAAWNASALIASMLPTLMDQGIAGTYYAATGPIALSIVPGLNAIPSGPVTMFPIFSYNSTPAEMDALIQPIVQQLSASGLLNITQAAYTQFKTYYSFFSTFEQLGPVGYEGLMSARLLSKRAMQLPQEELLDFLQRILTPMSPDVGAELVLDLVAGPGPANVPPIRQGGLLLAWRTTYLHAVQGAAVIDPTLSAKDGLGQAADWLNENIEPVWHEWEPDTGAYMHEANAFDPDWKEDFFGVNYGRLLCIKQKYDPSATLFVSEGVGSDAWTYDLDSGKLCRA